MKALLAALTLTLACTGAFAADDKGEAKKPTTQQERMKSCNKDAAGKKGDERKAFMSSCLKGQAAPEVAAAAPAGCDAMAAEKKLAGAAKSSFMKKCTADSGAAAPAAPAADACAKQVEEKKLAGAAKSSFIKKCEADAKK